MDTTRSRIRNPQELHLYSSPSDGGHHTQGGQDLETLGVGYREETTFIKKKKNPRFRSTRPRSLIEMFLLDRLYF